MQSSPPGFLFCLVEDPKLNLHLLVIRRTIKLVLDFKLQVLQYLIYGYSFWVVNRPKKNWIDLRTEMYILYKTYIMFNICICVQRLYQMSQLVACNFLSEFFDSPLSAGRDDAKEEESHQKRK